MKSRILNILLVITSLFGYLEWGHGNHTFLFQAEADVLSKLFIDPLSVVHPFTILPLVGQWILLSTLLQNRPSKRLTLTGLICLSVLLVFMSVVGVIGLNIKVFLSTLPFLTVGVFTVIHHRKK